MDWISIVPAGITIVLTFKTKKLIPSLLAGVTVGCIIQGGFLDGLVAIGSYMVEAVASTDSAYTLLFLLAFGAFAELIEMSGGISGFSEKVGKRAKSERQALGWAWYLSPITFFDSSFHIISVGTVLSPVIDRTKGSKEKLAFLLSVTSLQLIVLVPIATAYLGYMLTLVTNNIKDQGLSVSSYMIVAKSFLFNFFSWSMLFIGVGVTIFGLKFGQLKLGKVKEEKDELTQAHIEKNESVDRKIEEYPKNSKNLIVPVAFLLLASFFFFWWTGKEEGKGFINTLISADFNVSLLAGIITTLIFTSIFLLKQKISLAEIEKHIEFGAEKVLSLVLILILSWALTAVTQDLGFNNLINTDFIRLIPKSLLPAILFLLSGLIAYTLGSSWATWALMMPLAINLSTNATIPIEMMIGTVWAGGAVADVISPLSAQIAGTSFGKHLVTSLPYLLAGTAISIIGYIFVGFFT